MFKVSSLSLLRSIKISTHMRAQNKMIFMKKETYLNHRLFSLNYIAINNKFDLSLFTVFCSKLRGVCFDLVCMSVVMTLFLFPYKNGPISGACWIWGCMFCFCFCFGRGLVKKFCFFFLCTYHDFALTLDDNFSFLLCCFAFFVSFCILMTDFTQIRAILWLLLLLLLLACVKIYL